MSVAGFLELLTSKKYFPDCWSLDKSSWEKQAFCAAPFLKPLEAAKWFTTSKLASSFIWTGQAAAVAKNGKKLL